MAWIAPDTGSIRAIVSLFGTSTQMLPKPMASQFGPLAPVGPTVVVATILFVAESSRITVPVRVLAIQTAPGVVTTPLVSPTGMLAVTLRAFGSTRYSTWASQFVAHRLPAPEATPL